ncbi:hypothetical protein ACS3SW_07025 [Roseobacteraceae bacterium S113]
MGLRAYRAGLRLTVALCALPPMALVLWAQAPETIPFGLSRSPQADAQITRSTAVALERSLGDETLSTRAAPPQPGAPALEDLATVPPSHAADVSRAAGFEEEPGALAREDGATTAVDPQQAQASAVATQSTQALISQLSIDQARTLGFQAAAQGRNDIALVLADHVLTLDPKDSFGHYLRARAFLSDGQPDAARAPARAAFAHAKTDVQKHEAAKMAARSAVAREAYLPAQFWLRRAVQAAPDEVSRAGATRDFQTARRIAPLSARLSFSISPSDNVNGGASEEIFLIDGVPFVGILSSDALALSGTIMRAGGQLSYRVQRSARAETALQAKTNVQWVTLSDEASQDAPGASGRDFGYTVLETGVTHRRLSFDGGPVLSMGAHLGRAWFAGAHAYDTQRATLGLQQPIGTHTALHLGHNRQVQMDADGVQGDVVTANWLLGVQHNLANNDQISLSVFTGDTDSDNDQRQRTSKGLSLGYSRAKPIGPVTLSGNVTAREIHYPDYTVFFPVPGGRKDTAMAASLDVGLKDVSYLGFIPTVSLTRESTRSNVSRFETETTSVSIGFRSEF